MDTAFETILSYQFLLFCLAISALTYVIRLIVEYCFSVKNIVPKDNHAWNELILPILPIVLGCVSALLAKKYPFPDQITSYSGRAVFGLVAGSFSTIVWR